jgi:site-specific DNA-methyltransferase (adenine-specific)
MTPYYEEPGITIYLGDCRDVLPQLAPVDLVLTDPPYGLLWKRTGFQQNFKTDWRDAAKWDKRIDSLGDIVSAGKDWIIWGGNYYASVLGDCCSPLVWDKQTGANNFADGEMALTSFKTGTLRIFRHQWCGVFKDSERGERNEHPTQKPIALMKWCLRMRPDAAIVLDPFMGSGTTLVAAKQLGRRAIGIEIEERYVQIAIERLRQDVLPFAEPAQPSAVQESLAL